MSYKKERRRSIKYARSVFDIYENDENTIDDETWDDLMMDEVYMELDSTYSSPGEAVLYDMFRNPELNKKDLSKRSTIINKFKKDENLLLDVRNHSYNLGTDNKNICLDMITGDIAVSTAKYIIYSILSIIPILIVALGIILRQPYFLAALTFYLFVFPVAIHNYEMKNVNSKGLIYLKKVFVAAEKDI